MNNTKRDQFKAYIWQCFEQATGHQSNEVLKENLDRASDLLFGAVSYAVEQSQEHGAALATLTAALNRTINVCNLNNQKIEDLRQLADFDHFENQVALLAQRLNALQDQLNATDIALKTHQELALERQVSVMQQLEAFENEARSLRELLQIKLPPVNARSTRRATARNGKGGQ